VAHHCEVSQLRLGLLLNSIIGVLQFGVGAGQLLRALLDSIIHAFEQRFLVGLIRLVPDHQRQPRQRLLKELQMLLSEAVGMLGGPGDGSQKLTMVDGQAEAMRVLLVIAVRRLLLTLSFVVIMISVVLLSFFSFVVKPVRSWYQKALTPGGIVLVVGG